MFHAAGCATEKKQPPNLLENCGTRSRLFTKTLSNISSGCLLSLCRNQKCSLAVLCRSSRTCSQRRLSNH